MPLVEIFLVVVRYLRSSITQTTFVEISLCLFQHGPSALHVFRVAMTCRPRLFKVHILSLFRKLRAESNSDAVAVGVDSLLQIVQSVV